MRGIERIRILQVVGRGRKRMPGRKSELRELHNRFSISGIDDDNVDNNDTATDNAGNNRNKDERMWSGRRRGRASGDVLVD